ncbi:MAG: carboxypeptidase-like regulatory domain-containing protein, partial [Flavobacteriaceae bacterium]
MNKIYVTLIFLLGSIHFNGQIVGLVADSKGENLPFVNVFIKDTYKGTTTNDEGKYELKLSKKGKYTIVFQYLGFKTIQKKITIENFP